MMVMDQGLSYIMLFENDRFIEIKTRKLDVKLR